MKAKQWSFYRAVDPEGISNVVTQLLGRKGNINFEVLVKGPFDKMYDVYINKALCDFLRPIPELENLVGINEHS